MIDSQTSDFRGTTYQKEAGVGLAPGPRSGSSVLLLGGVSTIGLLWDSGR